MSTGSFDYTFEEELSDNFNPLEDLVFDIDDEEDEDGIRPGVLDDGPYGLPNTDNVVKFAQNSFDHADTATERIDALFTQMPTLDRMLIQILELGLEPIPAAQMDERVTELQKTHHSIFSPFTMCSLLERAGALIKCDEDGVSLEEFEQEPLKIEEDGVEYWQVAPAPAVYWTVTPEGRERYEAYKPAEMIKEVFEAEPHYRRFFMTTLEVCANPGGASMKVVDDLISDDPELQKPRRYAMYFIDKLEKAGALEWGEAWNITAAGLEYLNAAKEAAASETVPEEE